MNEEQALTITMNILKTQSELEAYSYLLHEKPTITDGTGQLYNFLYCLASLSGRKEEALNWLEEAIIKKGYWYRPEVFEDEDLKLLFGEKRFIYCQNLSNKMYTRALESAKTICTWKNKTSNILFLILHGNQQNIDLCRQKWDFLNKHNMQTEYLQSSQIDSKGLYRWEDAKDESKQIANAIIKIPWNDYSQRNLCGFSAGCNVILDYITKPEAICDNIVLVAPWIPTVNISSENIIKNLISKNIRVLMICGRSDEDCVQFMSFADAAKSSGVDILNIQIDNLAHEYPGNFNILVKNYFNIIT